MMSSSLLSSFRTTRDWARTRGHDEERQTSVSKIGLTRTGSKERVLEAYPRSC